jgi:hypothetical protein
MEMGIVDSIPDLAYIEGAEKQLSGIWSKAHANWHTYDDVINRDNQLWPDDFDRPAYHPGRAAATIRHAADNQLAFEPKIHRFPTSNEERAKRDADIIEPFVHAVFQETSLLEPSLTWKAVGRHLLQYGYAVVKGPIWDMTELADMPTKKRNEDPEAFEERMILWQGEKGNYQPFRIRAPHPATVFLDPMNKRPNEGIEVSQRYAIDVWRIVEGRKVKKGKRKRSDMMVGDFDYGNEPYRSVNTTEYWSLCWHAFTADGKLLFVEANTWGFMPYKHAFGGFGQLRTTDKGIEVRYLAVGILEPIMETLKIDAQAQSGLHNNLVEAAFPDENVIGDADSIRNQKAQGQKIIEMRNGESRAFMQPPEINRWMFESEKLLDADIEFGTFARNLAGLRQTGTFTVGQAAMQMQAAERGFLATNKQMEHMATLVGQDILKLVDLHGEELTIRGHTIKPSDLEHNYSLEATFEIADAAIEMQRRQIAMEEVNRGLKSKERYWIEGRVEDITKERMNLLEDSLREHPAVKDAMVEEMAKVFGLIPLLEKIKEQREKGQAKVTGGAIPNEGEPGFADLPEPITDSVARPSQVGQDLAGQSSEQVFGG